MNMFTRHGAVYLVISLSARILRGFFLPSIQSLQDKFSFCPAPICLLPLIITVLAPSWALPYPCLRLVYLMSQPASMAERKPRAQPVPSGQKGCRSESPTMVQSRGWPFLT